MGMPGDPVITARGLTKHYRDVTAVEALDLEVRPGEVYGFLGRNGAGKTTTIRMLLGLVRPSAGQARLFGRPVAPGSPLLGRIGYLVETAAAYDNLNVRENLEIQRRLTGAPRGAVDEAVRIMGLETQAHRRAGVLSLGNKQRLSLARALLHRPDLLILDEPANGLDPAGIVEVRELLRSLARDRGVTVFMSSHILTEVAHLADRIGIVHEGRLLEELDREGLRARSRPYLEVRVDDLSRTRNLLADAGFSEIEGHDGALRIFDGDDRGPEVARLLVEGGVRLEALVPGQEDLEAHFLRLTGSGSEDSPGAGTAAGLGEPGTGGLAGPNANGTEEPGLPGVET